MKKFSKIEYKGGHPDMTRPCNVDVVVDDFFKEVRITESGFSGTARAIIKSADIIRISFDERSKRSVGKTAAGAIIGGVLTGGIG
jgi:hypothetical protein